MAERPETGSIIRFDNFELETTVTFELRRSGSVIHVEPKVFDLIACLAKSHGQVLSRDQLIEQVWNGRFVSEATVSSAIKAARKALGDSGDEQKYIRTVRGRGFQFVAATTMDDMSVVKSPDVAPIKDVRPSIVVLPFSTFNNSIEHSALAKALAHDIIQALSRLRWIRVIARGTAFRFSADDVELDTLRTALDVRYCLTGVVEIEEANIRLTFKSGVITLLARSTIFMAYETKSLVGRYLPWKSTSPSTKLGWQGQSSPKTSMLGPPFI